MQRYLIRYYLVDANDQDKVEVRKKVVEAESKEHALNGPGEPNEDNLAVRDWGRLLNWTAEELINGMRRDGGPVVGNGVGPELQSGKRC